MREENSVMRVLTCESPFVFWEGYQEESLISSVTAPETMDMIVS
jgi:hypothetical protein